MNESKFSIITPTMWRYPPYLEFLVKLVNHDLIGEIIIINNDINNTPSHGVFYHPKIKMHNFKLNIFVNPAWNYGAGISTFNKLCILSDDVIFDTALFDKLFEELTVGKFIAISPEPPNSSHQVTGNVQLVPLIEKPWEFGSLMFMHKDDWIDIPAGLDVFHGDTWMWDTMILRYGQNYVIKDLNFFTPRSVTASTLVDRELIYIERECRLYGVAFENFKKRLQKQIIS